jgi:hypothetical protein
LRSALVRLPFAFFGYAVIRKMGKPEFRRI